MSLEIRAERGRFFVVVPRQGDKRRALRFGFATLEDAKEARAHFERERAMAETRMKRIRFKDQNGKPLADDYVDRWVFDRITRIWEYYKLGDLERLRQSVGLLDMVLVQCRIPDHARPDVE